MLVNLYDINLNYVKVISEEDLNNKENNNLFHKVIQLHIFDNNKKLIVPALLDIERSETIVETILKYFREQIEINDIEEKQIQISYMKTLINDSDFNGNVFLYNTEVYLNKKQTNKTVIGLVKNA